MMKYDECAVCELRDECAGGYSCFGYTNTYGIESDAYVARFIKADRKEFDNDWYTYISEFYDI